MIPLKYIASWSKHAPWQLNYQVEQDLLITRILIEIFNDPFLSAKLAFRGGTALHKLYTDAAPRYSEDIDLVQLDQEPIGPVMRRLRELIQFFEEDRTTEIRGHGAKAFHKFNSEESNLPLKIKIEINCREHAHKLPLQKKWIDIQNEWYTGEANINTYNLNELLGSKLRALYQRPKGRDLYDLYFFRDNPEFKPDVLLPCFKHYMDLQQVTPPTSRQYELNLLDKMNDPAFTKDMDGLLNPGITYNIHQAHEWIMDSLIPLIDQYKTKTP